MTDGAFPPPPPSLRPPGSPPAAPPPTNSPPPVSATPPPPRSPAPPPPPPPPPGLTPPEGYVAYQNGPHQTAEMKRIGGIATSVIGLVALAGLAGVVNAIVQNSLGGTAEDFLADRTSASDFDDAFAVSQLVSALQSVLGLAAGVVTIIWMYRIAKNVRGLGRTTTWSPLFSIFGWVLPPFLFVIPLLVMRELWKASDPTSPATSEGWKSSRDNPLLYAWLVAYGIIPAVITGLTIGSVIDAALNASGSSEANAEAIDASSGYTIISGVVVVVAAALWIVIVRQLTDRHTRLTGEH